MSDGARHNTDTRAICVGGVRNPQAHGVKAAEPPKNGVMSDRKNKNCNRSWSAVPRARACVREENGVVQEVSVR